MGLRAPFDHVDAAFQNSGLWRSAARSVTAGKPQQRRGEPEIQAWRLGSPPPHAFPRVCLAAFTSEFTTRFLLPPAGTRAFVHSCAPGTELVLLGGMAMPRLLVNSPHRPSWRAPPSAGSSARASRAELTARAGLTTWRSREALSACSTSESAIMLVRYRRVSS